MDGLMEWAQQHSLLIGLFFVGLFLLLSYEWERFRTPVTRLLPQDLVQLMNQQKAMVLDLRSKEEFEKGYVPHAHSLPLSSPEWNTFAFPSTQPIVLICGTGEQSQAAAQQLHQKGLSLGVFLLEGGLNSWRQAGLPLIVSDASIV